ncbi:hypothetical protein NECID01_0806 [Nematocida sp. AWRm77]|nr:hypothetical protein NECID01_0806 [Nematocida sp. AWRm77]
MLERVEKAAEEAETGLNSECALEKLNGLVQTFQTELQKVKDHARLHGSLKESSLSQLEQRLLVCKRRLGIIRMSEGPGLQNENLYLKKRPETDYYQRNRDNLKDYIKIASHSIHSIDKQKTLMKNSRRKLEEGLEYLGFSDRMVDQISNRYLTDYRIFQSLVVCFVLLFIYVVFLRKS